MKIYGIALLLLSMAFASAAAADSVTAPTADELQPMRIEYFSELAKITEPPEMAKKPMQVRKTWSSTAIKAANAIVALRSPEKATHSQRVAAINGMLELVKHKDLGDSLGRTTLYVSLATLACIDGADSQTVIGYANNAIGDEGDDMLALRARMYLKAGKLGSALDDLEKIMVDLKGRALSGGGVNPQKETAPCSWSIADFDAFGDDPRALAAKGLYLSSFLSFSAKDRGTVTQADILDLYTRSSRSWRSPIPHYLAISTFGFGSEHWMTNSHCIRASGGGHRPETKSACARYDDGIRQQIRKLTMALVIDPKFAPALSARAGKYLQLAQSSYADGKPSLQLFELAINDYTTAIAAGGKDKRWLFSDRALALASIGRYKDAASGYVQGMKYAKNGIEEDPVVYQQLAGLYMKLGQFNEAADTITQAIINSPGAGMNVVLLFGGIREFRTLYPEYELLPDEILAETVRRRYKPELPQSWNTVFISKGGNGNNRSSILPELYIMRGDAYSKAGRREQAMADYRRVKSDAWYGEERSLPRHFYFDENGRRNYDVPEPFPPPPPKL